MSLREIRMFLSRLEKELRFFFRHDRMPGYKRFLVRFHGYINDLVALKKIEEAYRLAKEAHRGQYRGDGVTHYFHHVRHVADIISCELGLKHDWKMIVAALLHDAVEDTFVTIEMIRERFGETVAYWVELLTKGEEYKKDKSSYVRQLLESLCIEVLIIKLSDRLANLRTLGMKPKEEFQVRQINETILEYLPLADILIDLIANSEEWSSHAYVGVHLKSALEAQIASFRAEYGDRIIAT